VGLWDHKTLSNLAPRITMAHNVSYYRAVSWRHYFRDNRREITGVKARIIRSRGQIFSHRRAHKVGGALRDVWHRGLRGRENSDRGKAEGRMGFPTGNLLCRGGAFELRVCSERPAVAILPEGMSRERFDWLRQIGPPKLSATPGPNLIKRKKYTTNAGR